jgi:glutamine synthetase
MMTRDQLARAVKSGEIDTVFVGFTDHYGRLMGKRLEAGFFLSQGAHGTHACNYLLTVDMEMDPVPGYRLASWEKGYGDFHLTPDFSTLRRASWLDRTALVLCDVDDDKTRKMVAQAPRTLLKSQLARCAAAGLKAFAASELEYFLFKDSYRDAAAKGYAGLQPAGWYLEDYHGLQGAREDGFNGEARRHLARSGVPVESSKGEWGLGQNELSVRYAEALEMADRHVVYKQCLKELADKMGLSVTFMAKPSADQAGSGCHIHFSLARGGKNAFAGNKKLGPGDGFGPLPLVLGRLDRPRAGGDGVLRADGELL